VHPVEIPATHKGLKTGWGSVVCLSTQPHTDSDNWQKNIYTVYILELSVGLTTIQATHEIVGLTTIFFCCLWDDNNNIINSEE
jgi:hypothetical protein